MSAMSSTRMLYNLQNKHTWSGSGAVWFRCSLVQVQSGSGAVWFRCSLVQVSPVILRVNEMDFSLKACSSSVEDSATWRQFKLQDAEPETQRQRTPENLSIYIRCKRNRKQGLVERNPGFSQNDATAVTTNQITQIIKSSSDSVGVASS